MDEQRIRQIVREEIQNATGFKGWIRSGSVTDQYSPITGASMQIGFFGTSKQSKQTVTGSRSSVAALTNLLTALATYGLITDSSS